MSSDAGFACDVALSFGWEERANAAALAECLAHRGITVYLDMYEEATLQGRDLYEHLHDVYARQARFCVIFVSAEYAQRIWNTPERRAAQTRAISEKGPEYMVPIRLDDTTIPGLPATADYVPMTLGIARISELLIAKLTGDA